MSEPLNYKNDSSPLPRPLTVTREDDPAHALLMDSHTSTPVEGVYRSSCYICRDPEFAQMGLPLCMACPSCEAAGRGKGHVPADDVECTDCKADVREGGPTQA